MDLQKSLYINLFIGAITFLSNSAAALMMTNDLSNWTKANVTEAIVFAFIGFLLVFFALLAIRKRISLNNALGLQVLSLAVLVTFLTLWGISVLISQSLDDTAVSWTLGILSGLAIYLFYISTKVLNVTSLQKTKPFLQAICFFAIIVDIGMFAKIGWF